MIDCVASATSSFCICDGELRTEVNAACTIWSLLACDGGELVVAGVVCEFVLIVFDGGAVGAGWVSCGAGRGSMAAGVGASVTLGSTEANLGVVNGSDGCTEGVSNDPKKSKVQDQHNKESRLAENKTYSSKSSTAHFPCST